MEVENSDQKSLSLSSDSNSILKKLERYLSKKSPTKNFFTRSRSWHLGSTAKRDQRNEKKATRNGYFSVYVGPEKQRFVIKAELANHPLFKMLLEDAELEYGFEIKGPLLLPCDVGLFYKVLAEMEYGGDQELDQYGYGRGSPFSPARRLGKSHMAKGCGSYGLLTPPRFLKNMNNF